MTDEFDDEFYKRADAFIHLANDQCEHVARGKVSASFMYAAARYNAYVSATGYDEAAEMMAARSQTVDYFVEQYRAALEENLDDYINNFDSYVRGPSTH